jgi:hypothetical protein
MQINLLEQIKQALQVLTLMLGPPTVTGISASLLEQAQEIITHSFSKMIVYYTGPLALKELVT